MKVDVLAVMHEASCSQEIRSDREDMREAHDAVSELIEAAKRVQTIGLTAETRIRLANAVSGMAA